MKKFRVIVNGEEYEVEIEDISAASSTGIRAPYSRASAAVSRPIGPRPSAPAAASAALTVSMPVGESKPATTQPTAKGTKVSAPMPGNILAVNVSEGQTVNKGDVLAVLEAMKMENEIMAPCTGTINKVSATVGTTVTSGTLLFLIT